MAKKKTWWDYNKEHVAKKLINEWKVDKKQVKIDLPLLKEF